MGKTLENPYNTILSPKFPLGTVLIEATDQKFPTPVAIIAALSRHTHCDFGDVTFEHHNGNLELIGSLQGVISSVYGTKVGERLYIITKLDDFDPKTNVFMC
jgi:hypothetical protein